MQKIGVGFIFFMAGLGVAILAPEGKDGRPNPLKLVGLGFVALGIPMLLKK